MSRDIRRMTREELDTLNAEGRAWREARQPQTATPLQEPSAAESLANMQDCIQPQLDLWEKEEQ
jgi:hypothetical protein